jgi:uncharacterized membrane protein
MAAMTDAPPAATSTSLDEERRLLDAEVSFAAAERLTFFSDAVVAIAITLLALELPVPTGNSDAAVWHSLGRHLGEYIAFLISFAVIGGHWFAHHRLFRYVSRLGGHLGGLNMLWLLMMVITPWITKTLSPEGDTSNSNSIRFSLYAAVQALAGLIFLLMSWEIHRHELLRPHAPATLRNSSALAGGTITLMFAVSIPLFWVTHYAWVCWIIGGAVMRIVGSIARRNRKATQPLS